MKDLQDFTYKNHFANDKASHLNAFRDFLNTHHKDKYDLNNLRLWSGISNVSANHIAEYILASRSELAPEYYKESFALEVAPKGLIIEDFGSMSKEKYLHVNQRERFDISARAIQGHAHEGHTVFRPQRFPNTTTVDVISALETTRSYRVSKKPAFSLEDFQSRTQEWIDEIVTTLDDFFEQPQKYMSDYQLTGTKGRSFARLGWMENQSVNMLEVIRGFYFASQMDNFELRQQIQSHHDNRTSVKLGGGSCLPVNVDILKTFSASMGDYAHITYARELVPLNHTSPKLRERVLAELGIIVPATPLTSLGEKDWHWNDVKTTAHDMRASDVTLRNVYVRGQKGVGVADDVAIVLATILPQTFTHSIHRPRSTDGVSRMIGATLADLVDTLEKDSHLIFGSGQDETIGLHFNHRFKQACKDRKFREWFNVQKQEDNSKYTLVSEPVLRDFVAASANHPVNIHSSQRYFHLDVDGTCAINEYLKFVGNIFFQYGLPYKKALHTPNAGYTDGACLTFQRIPVEKVIHEMGKRVSLVRNPSTREQKVHDFFAKKAQDNHE